MQVAHYLSRLRPSYIREILAAATDPGVISLAGGLPAEQSFPLKLMSGAIADLINQPALFQYGQTQGYIPLLEYCQANYCISSEHAALICTGSQQALDLVARTFLDPGDQVVVESPSYLGALQVFAIAKARVETVEQGVNGPDLEQLENLFSNNHIKLFYAVPDFHNPTGVCWSIESRKQVAVLCQHYGVTLLEDAPYRDIRFSGRSLPLVSTFCPERSLLLRSFSKIVAPGIRMGVVLGKQKWIEPMVRVKQAADLHSNIPMQCVLLAVLQHPEFTRHVKNICNLYAQRYSALSAALTEQLDHCGRFNTVEGGMFVWLKINSNNTMEVAKRAIKKKVAVVPGEVFYPDPGQVQPYLRLNFSHTPAEKYQDAIDRLSSIL